MTQKETPAVTHSDEPATAPTVHPHSSAAGTAPEVPHEIAKQYNLHKEPLHQPIKPPAAATESPASKDNDTLASSIVEDPETDAAVDDILSKESDELLGIEDKAAAAHQPIKRSFGAKLKGFFKSWWRNKVARYITLGVLAAAIIVAAVVPTTRYGVLNLVGVRSSASVVVLDSTTQLPLKNVSVSLNSQTAQTNKDGVATIRGLKLGKYHLHVKRLAFAKYDQDVTIGWGSNPLGSVSLRAVGIQYQIEVKDYLSGKPISGAEAESDELNALSDKAGKITLTVDDTSATRLAVTINANGYRSEPIELNAATEAPTPVSLVLAQKTVFISKASGRYDVYSSYIDGKDKKIVAAGTGLENNNISLVVSPDNKQAALVSTRDNLRDEDGYLLYALTFINIEDGTAVTVDHAQQLQLVDWIDGRLVYRSTIAAASASNPQRNRLVAYDFSRNSRLQLATANQFNTILSANGYIYYAPSGTDPGAALGLYRVKPDSSSRERLSEQEVWTGLRSDINTLSLQTPGGWMNFDLASKKMQPSSQPSSLAGTVFLSNTQNDHTAWTETRDGKGVLLVRDNANDKITSAATQPGLTYPFSWLNSSTLLYRVVTSGESADYVVNIQGGAARKVGDVTASHGYIQAY